MEGHAHVEAHDDFGKKVGLQAAVLAVLLSTFTICAHRAHTETIVEGNAASDTWAHYQAKRVRDFQLEMNSDLLRLTAGQNSEAAKTLESYAGQREKYKEELADLKKEAEAKARESEGAHRRARYFDLSEGVIEISLVMSSLYFLSRRKFFPATGLLLGIAGTAAGAAGLFLR